MEESRDKIAALKAELETEIARAFGIPAELLPPSLTHSREAERRAFWAYVVRLRRPFAAKPGGEE